MAAGPSDRLHAVVQGLLLWPPTWFIARLMLVSAYLLGGVVKLADWPAAVAEQAHFGMSPPAFWAAATIAVEIAGSLLILSGRLVWLGAVLLGGFTVLAALVANAFWTMEGAERFASTNAFFEHIGLAGGFVIAALAAARMPQAPSGEPEVRNRSE